MTSCHYELGYWRKKQQKKSVLRPQFIILFLKIMHFGKQAKRVLKIICVFGAPQCHFLNRCHIIYFREEKNLFE